MSKRFIELAEPIEGPIVLRGKAADWMIEYLKTHPPDPEWVKQQIEKDKKAIRRMKEMGITFQRVDDLSEILGEEGE